LSDKQMIIVENDTIYVKKSGLPLYLKTADICAMTGKSNQWIGQLVSKGTIKKHKTPHGTMFESKEAIKAYCDMLEERSKGEEDKDILEAEKEKAEAEAKIKKSKAVIEEMKAEEVLGKMHRSEDVLAITEDLIYSIRSILISLPGRLAVDVKVAETTAEVAEVIKKEVYKAMDELSNYQYDAKKYEERVRERWKWDVVDDTGENDGKQRE